MAKIGQDDIQNDAIKQRHITGLVVFRGTSSERTTSGKSEKQAFFETDTNKLYIFNNVSGAWVSVTLS